MKHLLQRFALVTLALCLPIAAHAQVVVSQVYGGGGNSGATYKNDFIELRNNGSSPVNVSGWSVQYASSGGTSWARTNLTGSIPAGGYYLIRQAQGTGGSVDLPTPDATGTIPMSGTAGKIALVSNQTTLSGACPLGGAVVDFVGFGSAANCSETAPTATLSNSTAALRKGDGSIDTGNNNADFAIGAPNPRNSSSEPPPPPPVATPLTIAEIQGAGQLSAHIDVLVVTEGVVTALKFNSGFFLQSLAADADPATSEAVFVFTSSAPTVSVGSHVRVTATVKEFTPGSNLNQLPITELDSPSIQVLATGVALPAPVELTVADLNPGNLPGTLERLEGMRVRVAQARVVEASDGNIDENDALSSTSGVFQVVLPDVARPYREPGIGVLDVMPIPADKHPPRFDTNQERLMVRSRGQVGASPLAVDVDAVVTGLVGVLDYNTGTWALTPDPGATIGVSGGKSPVAVSDAGATEVTIGSFNLLRFFDDVADGNGAVRLTTDAMNARLAKTSVAICDWLKAPDILGVVEVENLNILGKLADQLNGNCAAAPAYVPYLVQGNDVGGINVGFLVSTRANADGSARVVVGDVVQYGNEATLANPDGSTSLLNDRPPLLLRATVRNANGASYPVTVVVNHLRSLNDIDSTAAGSSGWSTSGERVRAKRAAQAAYLGGIVNWLQENRPQEKIVLLGDFNAFEFNDGYVDVMGIVRGQAAAQDQVLTWAPSPVVTPLIDGSELIADPAERYSYVFAGNAQTLDHVLVNEPLVLDAATARVEHARINADFGVHHFGEAGNALRVSDHDPVRLAIEPPQFRNADLSVALSGPAKKLHSGSTHSFPLIVANNGPQDAWKPVVVLRGDALASDVRIQVPGGWTCSTAATADGFELRCASEQPLAAGASAAFEPEIRIPKRPNSTYFLTLDAVVGAQSTDPALGNNNARYQNRIVGIGGY